MPLKPGDRIDRYVIDGHLGSGGMGEVYRAHDPRLKRAIALKILAADVVPTDPNAKTSSPVSSAGARMLREAQLAASLDHPNVVAIFDVGQLEAPPELRGTTYLAMELIRGESLRKYIGDASVKMKVRVRWLEEIARALGAAHAAGLVHRDVKPENVMIREDGTVKVLDFGIAKRTTAAPVDVTSSTEGYAVPTATQQGAVVGTPMYMAPEQLRAEPLDGRTDQFAWGVVAYELLTGKALWSLEGGGFSLVAQILQAPPPSTSTFTGVPERVAAVVVKALAKDPAARFPTMGALVAELIGRTEAGDTDGRIRVPGASDMPAPRVSAPSISGEVVGGATSDESPSTRALHAVRTLASQPAARPEEPRASPRRGPRSKAIAWGVASLFALGGLALGAAKMLSRSGPGPVATGADAASSRVHPGCASNAECRQSHDGKPWVCHRDDGTCVPLESEDCGVRADARALDAEDTVWIGTMYPLKGAMAKAFGIEETEGVDLGRRDFAEVLSGYAGSSRQIRPLGLVTCDDSVDATRAARHLAEDVRVPAVIGFGKNAEAVETAESVFVPRHTLVVSAINSSPMITSIPSPPGDPRLVWRTMFSTTQAALPLVALVSSVFEPRIKAAQRSTAPLRVALLRIKTMTELAFADALQGKLVFNGKTALNNGTNFRDIVVDDPFAPGAKPAFDAAIDELLSFSPDIVLFLSGDALAKSVLVPLEERWPKGARPPLYASASPIPNDLLAFVGANPERRRRFFGVTNVSTTPNNVRLAAHFNETFHEKVTRTTTPNGSYDAIYVIAYATLALGNAPVTGPALSRALGRLAPPGKTIDVGPLAILDGYGMLSGGANIDVEGTMGHLDLDPASGEAPIDMAVLCVDIDRRGVATSGTESGLVYDVRASALEGELRCP